MERHDGEGEATVLPTGPAEEGAETGEHPVVEGGGGWGIGGVGKGGDSGALEGTGGGD